MRGVNRVMLIGNLGKDPDVQYLEGNIAVAKFSLATTETYKDRSGKLISQTEWHTVVLWRGLAELAQKYLHKGSLVYIEGRLRTRSWEDKEGNKKFATEVVGEVAGLADAAVRPRPDRAMVAWALSARASPAVTSSRASFSSILSVADSSRSDETTRRLRSRGGRP